MVLAPLRVSRANTVGGKINTKETIEATENLRDLKVGEKWNRLILNHSSQKQFDLSPYTLSDDSV
jgi:hypothetical protein